MNLAQHRHPFLLLLVGLILHVTAGGALRDIERPPLDEALRVAAPAYVQVLLAFGDRFLAANLGMFRAVTLSALARDPLTYEVQAKLQQQSSMLNPRHEDNMYLAAAILPWNNQVDRAQWILNRATESRHWDDWPPFFQGFNAYYFNGEHELAGDLAILAAERTPDEQNRRYFRIVASKWYAGTMDKSLAMKLLEALKSSTSDADIKTQLDARIAQVKGLQTIQTAVDLFRITQGAAPEKMDDLLHRGYLLVVPEDPFRQGYGLDEQGNAVVLKTGRAK